MAFDILPQILNSIPSFVFLPPPPPVNLEILPTILVMCGKIYPGKKFYP